MNLRGTSPDASDEVERRWSDLGWWDRTALSLGFRSPESTATATAMLAQARRLRQRRVLVAGVGGVGATVVWMSLSLLFGAANDRSGAAWVVSALVFGVVFFAANVWVSGRQAARLEARATEVLESSGTS